MRRQPRNPLTSEEVTELIKLVREGDLEARNTLYERNLRLVYKVCFRYVSTIHLMKRIEMEDLFQESSIGLIRAIELFSPEKGFAFSTYATWWIKQRCTRYIDDQKSLIRMPVYACQLQRKFSKIEMEIGGKDEEFYLNLLAKETNHHPDTLKSILAYRGQVYNSIEEENEDGNRVMDLEDVTQELEQYKIDNSILVRMMCMIPERDKKILDMRMNNYTLAEIGEEIGISKEAVRLIEKKTLIKLRALVNRSKFERALK